MTHSVAKVFVVAVATLAISRSVRAQQNVQTPPVVMAPLFYAQYCSSCHDKSETTRAPSPDVLRQRPPEAILEALTTGAMAIQAEGLTDLQKRAMAIFLSGRPFGGGLAMDASAMPNRCTPKPLGNPLTGSMWNGWGSDLTNSRFQAASAAGLTPDQVPKLRLKWAFGFPNANSAYSQPAIVGGRVYVGSDAAVIYSLDAATGCVYWSYRAKAGVRTALSVGPVKGRADSRYAVYFGDIHANVYALDAETGALLWTERADPHPLARITGAPALYNGRLYVPVASLEEAAGGNPKYSCCTFRGSVVAYDGSSGHQIWKSYTIRERAQPTKKTAIGTQLYGPSGGAIWSAPTIDVKRRLLYVATGDAYSDPTDDSSDAILAFELATGRRKWTRQLTEKDAWLVGCDASNPSRSETCPDTQGPDFDFGSNPILKTLPDGKTILTAGQKSGIAWGLDPDRLGQVLWQQRVGKGSAGGGVVFGPAADDTMGYFATNDQFAGREAGGVTAVQLATGEQIWRVQPGCAETGRACQPAQPGAVTVIPGVVYAGTLGGTVRAHSTVDGHVLWEYDTAHEYETVNGIPAKGGALSGPGPVVVDGVLFMNSGYSAIGGDGPGNVLLAFGIP